MLFYYIIWYWRNIGLEKCNIDEMMMMVRQTISSGCNPRSNPIGLGRIYCCDMRKLHKKKAETVPV